MKFPVKVSYRKAEAKIYGKSAAYPFYGISYRAAGKRHVRSFSSYNEAKVEAETKVRKIANGNQTTASNIFLGPTLLHLRRLLRA